MTLRAVRTLQQCQVIVGYTVYVDLIREHFADKEFLTTPMRQETERCRLALKAAEEGRLTAMICSGDAGVYGMAGVLLELAAAYHQVEIEVVPGVTAAVSGAAVLGAPLMHDFAVISLSDLMTPWERIEQRLRAAAAADFIICLYNPCSKEVRLFETGLRNLIRVPGKRQFVRLCKQYRTRRNVQQDLYLRGAYGSKDGYVYHGFCRKF